MRQANGLDEFYSRTFGDGSCELFLDLKGLPTIDYPHIHVIHHENGDVDIIASLEKGEHIWRQNLRNPDGNQVKSAIVKAQQKLVDALK